MVTPNDLQILLNELHRRFNPSRLELLNRRHVRHKQGLLGEPDEPVRAGEWQVAPVPAALQKRTVEITGPAEPKMIINALNSGADVFMADFEDALSPTFDRIREGHKALTDAVHGTLKFTNEQGKTYTLGDKLATLKVRPRGLHLVEKHQLIDGEPMSGSLFDFGVFFFHNARTLLERGLGPYFYLPKLESRFEARWWNDVFNFAQDHIGIPRGSIRATVLIETAPAAFEMEEILFELREHIDGLNAGRWDYLFSFIKNFKNDLVYGDRDQLTMTLPFMQAYCEKLVHVCHKRGAHAIGGMAAFIPNRQEPEVTQKAFEKVRADKTRESRLGFDGTWVAHPDLIALGREEFEKVLGSQPHQKNVRPALPADSALRPTSATLPSSVSETGVRNNIYVTLVYLDHWFRGQGAVGILNLMEDMATAEISRSQLWQWLHKPVTLTDGREFTAELFEKWTYEELHRAGALVQKPELTQMTFKQIVLNGEFAEFLSLPAYEKLQ